MIIYKATNKNNGKCYIGQTTKTLSYRMQQHLKDRKPRKFQYILQDNPDNFQWEIICECNNKLELDKMEKHYIDKFNSEYNMIKYTNKSNKRTELNENITWAKSHYVILEYNTAEQGWHYRHSVDFFKSSPENWMVISYIPINYYHADIFTKKMDKKWGEGIPYGILRDELYVYMYRYKNSITDEFRHQVDEWTTINI